MGLFAPDFGFGAQKLTVGIEFSAEQPNLTWIWGNFGLVYLLKVELLDPRNPFPIL